jgi:hypothetical protein
VAQSICGHCGVPTHLTLLKFQNHQIKVGSSPVILQGAYTCDNCHMLSVASVRMNGAAANDAQADAELNAGADWSPKVGQSPQFPDVPPHIAEAAQEAYRASSIGARKAAILMARTVIEATAKSKGITTGRLVSKIDAMQKANLIRPDIAAAAHEIRLIGNDMAHGDIDYAVSEDDADDVLTLMSQVLSEVFQGPALLIALKERRAKRDEPEEVAPDIDPAESAGMPV